ncbi:MAG: hypothetical protein K2O08_03060 [Clostridia bacterium]|nr:hypothetical protein [Clostridia bacterium]
MIKKCGDGSVKIELPQDSNRIEHCMKYINKNRSDFIWIDADDCLKSVSLDFLYKIENPEVVKHLELCGNIIVSNAIYRFVNLTELSYYVKNKSTSIDLSKFPKLKILDTAQANQLKNLDKSSVAAYAQYDDGKVKSQIIREIKGLVDLRLHGPKDFSFDFIENPEKLKIVFFTQGNVKDLSGIERIKNLHLLSLSYCRSMSSIEGISKVPNLKKLRIDSCPKLQDISEIKNLENLKVLILENIKKCDLSFLEEMKCVDSLECLVLRNCGSIPSIKFFERYPNLQCFDFLYTNIIDGDLTPCLKLKEACTFNKRHYNLKDSQLPDSGGYGEWWIKED